jgi:uncharacterized protein
MAHQYTPTSSSGQPVEVPEIHIANPIPLGLIALAFGTVLLGCAYAGFIIPFSPTSLQAIAGAVLLFGGLVQFLAGMWSFRRNHTVEGTLFSAYGGFLAAVGLVFLPRYGFFTTLPTGVFSLSMFNQVQGLFFLCWVIISAIMVVGSLRANRVYLGMLVLLLLAFIFLTIGALAGGNATLLHVGGWLAIVCALVAWYAALVSLASAAHTVEETKLPFGRVAHGDTLA